MILNRRSFLKGLLGSTALVALPLVPIKNPYDWFFQELVTYQGPGNVGFEVGRVIGNKLFPKVYHIVEAPRLKNVDWPTVGWKSNVE